MSNEKGPSSTERGVRIEQLKKLVNKAERRLLEVESRATPLKRNAGRTEAEYEKAVEKKENFLNMIERSRGNNLEKYEDAINDYDNEIDRTENEMKTAALLLDQVNLEYSKLKGVMKSAQNSIRALIEEIDKERAEILNINNQPDSAVATPPPGAFRPSSQGSRHEVAFGMKEPKTSEGVDEPEETKAEPANESRNRPFSPCGLGTSTVVVDKIRRTSDAGYSSQTETSEAPVDSTPPPLEVESLKIVEDRTREVTTSHPEENIIAPNQLDETITPTPSSDPAVHPSPLSLTSSEQQIPSEDVRDALHRIVGIELDRIEMRINAKFEKLQNDINSRLDRQEKMLQQLLEQSKCN